MRIFTLLLLVLFTGSVQTISAQTIVEVTDTSLTNVSYHQISFPTPTKLVFTNLTSVSGNLYFHKNINLVGVEFPALNSVGGYLYFHQNTALTEISLPQLLDVGGYFYVHGNTALTEIHSPMLTSVGGYIHVAGNTALNNLDMCNVTTIGDGYSITGSPLLPQGPPCFVQTAPTSLSLSSNTIAENQPLNTLVGQFSVNSDYSGGAITYEIVDPDYPAPFYISGNQLYSARPFDHESQPSFTISVKATNPQYQGITTTFTIAVTDVVTEPIQTIVIDDATAENVYYPLTAYTEPTKLVFPNLVSVSGNIYFHKTTNIVAVEFPVLQSVDGHVYFQQNTSMEDIDFPALQETGNYLYFYDNDKANLFSAPQLTTVSGYVFFSGNDVLTILELCSLETITQVDEGSTPYYYLSNNPMLDEDTLCFDQTEIIYEPLTVPTMVPGGMVLGTFMADTSDPVTYVFTDNQATTSANGLFSIVGNQLIFTGSPSEFATLLVSLSVSAYRTSGLTTLSVNSQPGLTERKDLVISVDATTYLSVIPVVTEAQRLFPNPASNRFEIQGVAADESVTVSDMTGRVVFSRRLSSNGMDISGLSNGTYIVSGNTMSGKAFQLKLVVKQ
ncbi:MAG TPA: T9SS type A sorting domain-containing protein [Flavobacterium sp.]|nr:T9SS type A sorting domain-containing protein [Flavobacterium sp.]